MNNTNQMTGANDSNVLDHQQAETGLSEYTMSRILKWLEDIEASQTGKSSSSHHHHNNNNTLSGRLERSAHVGEEGGDAMNDDYNLSDYDSLDEQLLEYNRVVDKTFHIVHDE